MYYYPREVLASNFAESRPLLSPKFNHPSQLLEPFLALAKILNPELLILILIQNY